ncbi:MAG: glycosyltransferase family 4 protein [Flavipsychrobacter sp.]|jgi:glycosyltransferase involved in cell wall biosynthesis|nr:glycosyltransferase family 4 protein [Flavipsychrobacter sp.]
MKVLQVIDTLDVGGAERVFVDMVNILTTSGIPPEVLLLVNGGQLEFALNKEIQVNYLRRANKYSLRKAIEAHRLFKKFDIVHVHMRHCYVYVRAVQMLFGGKYKVVFQDHYGDININKAVPFTLKLLKPRYYIGVSRDLTDWAEGHLKPGKIFLLPNTISLTPVLIDAESKGKKALLVANIRPTKNIEFAIDVCTQLGIALDIYGNRIDHTYYNYLSEKIADNPNIRIVEGVMNIPQLYHKYKFALHTARSETGPLVLLEYMAHGLPFVSYKTGEVANEAAADLPIHFVESFEVEKWKEHVLKIQHSDNLAEKLQAVFHAKFGAENYLEKCQQIYQAVDC